MDSLSAPVMVATMSPFLMNLKVGMASISYFSEASEFSSTSTFNVHEGNVADGGVHADDHRIKWGLSKIQPRAFHDHKTTGGE